jgi:pimeloyl-ACP methyl ester carboxylesterase
LLGLAAVAGCAGAPPRAPEGGATALAATTSPPGRKAPRAGELVTYKAGHPTGGESWRDDGDVLVSEIRLAGQSGIVTVARRTRSVTVEAGGKSVKREVPEGVIALENGSFQSYALAAEQFASASSPTPVRVLVPSPGVTLDGTIQVTPGAAGGRRVTLVIKGLEVIVDLDDTMAVTHATVAAQGVEVRPKKEPAPAVTVREAPSGVVAEPFEMMRDGVALRGDLWLPRAATAKVSVVLFIAGSGPTDRDGNNAAGLSTDAYRMLAEGLAAKGIASLRCDKRGVGASGVNFLAERTTIDEFAKDAAALAAKLKTDARFSSVALLGHSEGGLLALMVANDVGPSSVVLLSTAGRTFATLLHEQLSTQLDAAGRKDLDALLDAIRGGKSLESARTPSLAAMFPPTVHAFLRSVLDVDPTKLAASLRSKVAIIQGAHDAQVTVLDAQLLAKARPNARLSILPSMSHVLKDEASAALPQPSYSDPSRPLSPGLVDAVAAAVR